jgi:5-methylcytosine-specific restriction endonuclease McrA
MPTQRQILRAAVVDKRGRHCMYCGKGPLHKRALHLDHIVPTSLGGKDELGNLIVSCAMCNMRKGKKDAAKFVLDRIPQVTLELSILTALRDRFL